MQFYFTKENDSDLFPTQKIGGVIKMDSETKCESIDPSIVMNLTFDNSKLTPYLFNYLNSILINEIRSLIYNFLQDHEIEANLSVCIAIVLNPETYEGNYVVMITESEVELDSKVKNELNDILEDKLQEVKSKFEFVQPKLNIEKFDADKLLQNNIIFEDNIRYDLLEEQNDSEYYNLGDRNLKNTIIKNIDNFEDGELKFI